MNEIINTEFDFNEIDDIMKLSRLFCEILFNIQDNDFEISKFIDLDKEYDVTFIDSTDITNEYKVKGTKFPSKQMASEYFI